MGTVIPNPGDVATSRVFWLVLKTVRQARKMSQPALSKLTGIAQPHISRDESGRVAIDEDRLATYARAYGVSVWELLREGDPKATAKKARRS